VQRLKIRRSGLEAAVEGRILISTHKEEELTEVFRAFPAQHYVVVDDKPRILAAIERTCPTSVTTVLVLQGKYARNENYDPKPDITLSSIVDLRALSRQELGG
jgi:hypothetical protein